MCLYFPERESALAALLINPPKKHSLFSLNMIMFNSFMRLNTITKITDCRFNKGFCSFKPNTVKKTKKQKKTEPHLIRPTLVRHQVAPSLRQIRSSQQLQELLAFPLERGRLPDTRESQRVLPGPGRPGSCHALWGSCPGHTCGLWISSKLPPRAPPPFRPHSPPPSLNPPTSSPEDLGNWDKWPVMAAERWTAESH